MKWLIDNWTLLVVIASILVIISHYVRKFAMLSSADQEKKVREWLLWAVIATEKALGEGTGVAKLRYCYDLFVQRFPSLVASISFDIFAKWVDEALVQMREILETNKNVEAYVKD